MAEQKLIKLKINEREVQVPQGTLVIEATRRMGTEVPSFCYYPGLSLQAACRMCLVEVEKAHAARSEEHTSELQSHHDLVCRLLLEKKKKNHKFERPTSGTYSIINILRERYVRMHYRGYV